MGIALHMYHDTHRCCRRWQGAGPEDPPAGAGPRHLAPTGAAGRRSNHLPALVNRRSANQPAREKEFPSSSAPPTRGKSGS
jgi:hypothetical protein